MEPQNEKNDLIKVLGVLAVIIVFIFGTYFFSQQEGARVLNEKVKHSSVSNDVTAPFECSFPKNVKVGEPFYISFSFTNTQEIPAIAAAVTLKDCPEGATGYGEPGWEFDRKSNTFFKNNFYLEKGQNISSKLKITIKDPGVYQFKLLPSAQIGDLTKLGEYIVSVIVEDTPAAQVERQQQTDIQNFNNQIQALKKEKDIVLSKIKDINFDIDYEKDKIEYTNDNIEYLQSLEYDTPENIAVTNEQINNHRTEIREYQNKIQNLEAQLAMYQNDLTHYETTIKNLEQQIKALQQN